MSITTWSHQQLLIWSQIISRDILDEAFFMSAVKCLTLTESATVHRRLAFTFSLQEKFSAVILQSCAVSFVLNRSLMLMFRFLWNNVVWSNWNGLLCASEARANPLVCLLLFLNRLLQLLLYLSSSWSLIIFWQVCGRTSYWLDDCSYMYIEKNAFQI